MTRLKLKLPANSKGRDFICGDLHGMYDLLMEKLALWQFDKEDDRVFCVGDLIDRGPDSMKCLGLLNEPWFYATQGNHERMFLTYCGKSFSSEHSKFDFLRNGGDWVEDPCISIWMLDGFADLIVKKMPIVIEVGGRNGFRVTHARHFPQVPKDHFGQDSYDKMVWCRTFLYNIYDSEILNKVEDFKSKYDQLYILDKRDRRKRLTYVGHNTLPNNHNIVINDHYMLDTRAYKRGRVGLVDYMDLQPDLSFVEHTEIMAKLK